MQRKLVSLALVGWLVAAMVACGAAEEPVDEPREDAVSAAQMKAIVATVIAEASAAEVAATASAPGSNDPVGAGAGATAVASATPTEPAPTPTATLEPTATSEPTATPEPTPTPEPTAAPEPVVTVLDGTPVVTCTTAYREWLAADKDWVDARDLTQRLPEFRSIRPDCVGAKFDPIFSQERVCWSRGEGSYIEPYPSLMNNVKTQREMLGPTRQVWVGLLVHFEKLPTLDVGGCWYHDRANAFWTQALVRALPKWLSGEEEYFYLGEVSELPELSDAVGEVAAEWRDGCERELRSRLASGVWLADDANDFISDVRWDIPECTVGWYPVAGKDQIVAACPPEPSGWTEGGDRIVHWEQSPDGSWCWVWLVEQGQWLAVSEK